MSYTKDMRRDRIKKTITYLSLLFWLCLLVACGQQEETTDDGVTYFHHSIADRNTQETQENSTETEKSEEFLLTAVRSDSGKSPAVPVCGWNGIPVLLRNRHPFL